eukprot:gene1446-1534_t
MEKNTAGSNVLRIGDYVTFKNIKHNGLLCAEGILLEDLIIEENIKVFDDSLFCIHLQRQYSAARELEEFLRTNKIDPKNISDANLTKYFQALKRGADNESRLNDSYMQKKLGQTVVFGDIIQLYHVKSGKYLKVIPDQLAKDERENIRIVLDSKGSSYSWMQVCPRYKIDRDGDRVLNNSEIYLKVAERSNEYLHRADRDPLPGHEREVNCSLEATSWRLNIFQSSVDSVDKRLLLSSELIYISDPETHCNVTISLPPLSNLEDNNEVRTPLPESESLLENEESHVTDELDTGNYIDNADYAHQFGDIVLQPYQDFVNSNFLWFIETNSSVSGGPIRLKTQKVKFKHLNTGKYLKVDVVNILTEEEDECEKVVLTTTSDSSDPSVFFEISELTNPGKYLNNAKALQLSQSGVWVERGDVLDDGTYIIKGGREKSVALSLLLIRYLPTVKKVYESESDLVATSECEPLDAYVGLAARSYLRKYYQMTALPRNDTVNTLWPNANRGDLEFFSNMVGQLIYFSQGFPISSTKIELGIDKSDHALRSQRQHLLREQGTVDTILKMIHKLIPITERIDEIKNMPKKKKTPISDSEVARLDMGQLILKHCFNLLYYVILDNPENQIHVADFMPTLLAHLSSQELAGKCVTEMLSKNIELQETKIGKREIQIFVDKLRSSKMNSMYLQLLQSCCSCQGEGVDGNQTKVANALFSDTNDIIIQMHADYARLKLISWNQPTLYIPTSILPGSPIRGDNLIFKGLPQLSLAWTTNSIDFSPLGLFGRLSVNVEDLFGLESVITSSEGEKGTGFALAKKSHAKKASQEQKSAVANYFIAEMFLGAEMCLDRNYIAMHQMDNLFSYEVLVTILKLSLNTKLKAAAVRLLMCLYVDRDPQATSKIPCLTRTWSDIQKNNSPQLPFVEPSRRFQFALIQQLISEHIHEMSGTKWDELSQHMLKMLKTLILFNFYGTNDRMTDVIGPLIKALDRRNVADKSGGIFNKRKDALESSQKEDGEPKNFEVDTDAEIDSSLASSLKVKSFFGSLVDSVVGKTEETSSERTKVSSKVRRFEVPARYSKAPIYELETMVEAIDILAFAQKVIEDRNISLLLRYFYLWNSGSEKRNPSELFEQVVLDSSELTLGINDFDMVMIDNLMYEHTALVQSALEVLMAHHSLRSSLLEHARNIQLLASHGRERQFRIVDQMLQQLEQNAETHELWGEMETDADLAVNKQTKDILRELIEICRVRRYVLEFDEDYMADREIQDLYRNLGCFEICMKVMGLLDSVEEDEDGNLGEVASNTRSICLLCNELLYWFFLGNTKNQEMGYLELDFFLDTLDDEINSHLTIRAIFNDNEALMRQVPHSHLANLVDKIIKNGKSHHYLALFASISHDGERNVVENQFEIVKSLTSPGRLQKVACFFCSVDHPDYTLKRQLMEPFLNTHKDLSLEDLPPLLAYHLMFLEVLSGCTVGRMNITTVEAKVQSVFNYTDILQSILDPGTIVACKIRLSKFFYNSIIEVELKIPGLDQSPDIWKLLESYKLVLMNSKDELLMVDRSGWESAHVSRQRIEYIIVCIMIIRGFFTHYYQPAAFQNDDRENRLKNQNQNKIQFSLTHVDELILYFFTKIKEIHDLNSSRLSEEMKEIIFGCLEILNKSISGNSTIATFLKGNPSKTVEDSKIAISEEDDMELVEDPEKEVLDKFRAFLVSIESDTALQFKAENENVGFISILESLPFIADPVDAEVRYETLIKKLVFHIRENIKIVNNQKRLDSRVTKTSTWIIRAFRTMIENRMGMSIYERDDDGGLEQDIAAAPVVNALNSCGATALCLDLIAVGIDEKLQLEAIKLGVALLFKEGGALEVQQIMNNHLNKTNSELFFKQVRLTLQKLQAWHSWNQVIILPEGEEPKPPDEILIVRFLQLMCEGHYLPNQDIMREQSHNPVSYNLLDDFVNYLNCLSRIPCRTSTVAGIRLAATILEVIQGPCEGNQVHFALNTELIETLNRLNRAKMINDCVEDEEIELKQISIDIFQGLLEGQGEKSVVYERVLSVIHLDIIQMMSTGDHLGQISSYDVKEENEEKAILQTECVVLLQMLCNFKPSLYEELGISRNVEDIVGSGTAMIEVIWRGDIHRRFFHVPKVCDYLAKSSKDALIENVDRSNPENKLIDFLNRSHDLYREVKHQQYLTEMGVSGIFSRQNQNRATWITFILAVIINIMLLLDYSFDSSRKASLSPEIAFTVSVLNIIQSTVAGIVLILYIVVKIPVKYQSLEAAGYNSFEAVIQTSMEPMILYYVWYLLFSVFGQVFAYDFLPFLLMDIIVKNSTTRDVLNSVIYPRRQIVMGGIVILFLVQIYTFFTFLYFRTELNQQAYEFCSTFYKCYKVALRYGLSEGGGIGDVFTITVGKRWTLDVTYYFIVNVGMLNLISGVIITTFGQLREDKAKLMEDTVGVCFICSLDKQVFDRASQEPDGFKTHVKIDHNIWNYLYFIFLLWEQDRDDDDGLEQYVRRAIEANEIVWFPLNKAIRLTQAATKEESLISDIKKKIGDTETVLSAKLDRYQTDINIVLEQLNQTLKQDHTNSDPVHNLQSHLHVGASNDFEKLSSDAIFDSGTRLQQSMLYLYFIDIIGIQNLPAGVENIFVNVYMRDEIHTIHTTLIEGSTVKFPLETYVKLLESIEFEEDLEFGIQILYGDPVSDEVVEIVSLHLLVQQLLLAEDCRYELYLDGKGSSNYGKITLIPKLVPRIYNEAIEDLGDGEMDHSVMPEDI